MTMFRFLALVLFAGVHSASSPPRIVGGEPTSVENYPSIVQVDTINPLDNMWLQGCAGSILNIRYILSAAHCFEGSSFSPILRRIRAGASHRNTGGSIIYVEHAYNHPSYGLRGFDGDISVVKLISAIIYSPVIQRTSILSQGYIIPDNVPVVYAGWGQIGNGQPPSSVLLDVSVLTVSKEICRKGYAVLIDSPEVTENMICAGLPEIGGRGSCNGDSGGPLYLGNITIGVISWGGLCGYAAYPGVNTNVASYSDWIVATAV
ncbi:trypsin, alkaline B-like [Vanessa atalanta]|uniref:trypsin, alkaline B-like n=1 Tax=Vanessa atalanta TaxID=42275 RepID=UPI001FCD4173|nr:trypsin, alkaline B-like [Vanessa atalanta]